MKQYSLYNRTEANAYRWPISIEVLTMKRVLTDQPVSNMIKWIDEGERMLTSTFGWGGRGGGETSLDGDKGGSWVIK